MARTFKIIVPKPASSNAKGTDVKLYKANEIIKSEGEWQDDVMDTFIKNGWAMEVKVDSVDETVQVEAEVTEIKRARNETTISSYPFIEQFSMNSLNKMAFLGITVISI